MELKKIYTISQKKRKNWLFILGLCLALILVAGRQSSVMAKDIDSAILIDGLERTYHVHLPASYSAGKSYPVVIILHGAGGQGTQIAAYSGFSQLADKENFIAVYPDGYRHLWAIGWQDASAQTQKADDVAFISQMLDILLNDYSIDRNRVYVTGMSMGGMFSHRLAIELSERIAAVAPVSGTLPERMAAQVPGAKVPVLMIHGANDPIVPYAGGAIGLQRWQENNVKLINLSVAETARYWAKNNGCQLEAVTEKTIDNNFGDGTKVIVTRYKAMDGINDVWIYTIEGGGHTWPRTSSVAVSRDDAGKFRQRLAFRRGSNREGAARARLNLGTTSHEFDTSESIWHFFKPLSKI